MSEAFLPPQRDSAAAVSVGATRVVLAIAVLMLAGWMLLLHRIGNGDVYLYLGPYGLLVIGACEGLRRYGSFEPALGLGRSHTGRDVGIGVGVGVVMTLGTYAAYAIVRTQVPSLAPHVRDLYAAAQTETLGAAIFWTAIALLAEELLFRGLLIRELTRRVTGPLPGLISLAAYVVVEIGSGSWVLVLAALVCGAIWTAERMMTRSLIAPIVSHAIWTTVVIHVHPVIGAG